MLNVERIEDRCYTSCNIQVSFILQGAVKSQMPIVSLLRVHLGCQGVKEGIVL